MKIVFSAFFICVFLLPQIICAQGGTWAWMKGSNTASASPVYGTQGVPDTANTPQGLYQANYWIDKQGNFWVFGGVDSNFYFGETSDLWKYDPAANTWTWVKGTGLQGRTGVYGTKGVPSPANTPGARGWGALSWTDNNGDLWMYGGAGNDSRGLWGWMNDVWRYHIATNEWTWMSGADTTFQKPVYGTYQQPSPLNTPGAREENDATWVDDANNLWFFGGYGLTSLYYNDMWRFNVPTNQWVWMKGPDTTGNAGNYGIMGVEAATNLPPARGAFARMQDADGNFYISGGSKTLMQGPEYNDVWKFNIYTNNWTWIGGDSVSGSTGDYSNYCVGTGISGPMSRAENGAAQMRRCNNMLLTFGGYHTLPGVGQLPLNDLWLFDVRTLEWKWISGTNNYQHPGHYGTRGVASAANLPPGRSGHCQWIDKDGVLWLFGGDMGVHMFNDVWKFVPDTTTGCFTMPLVTDGLNYTLSKNTICKGDSALLKFARASQLGISPSASVSWLDSAQAFLYPDSNTSYTIKALSACSLTDSVTAIITINVLSSVVNLTGDTSAICPGDSTQICATNGFTNYTWNTGPATRCIHAKLAGAYYVTVTDNNGCKTESGRVNIQVHTLPSVAVSVNGDTLISYDAVSYQWYLNGNAIPNATSQVYVAAGFGNYHVEVTDTNGCRATSNGIIVSGINQSKADVVSVYPNPLLTGNWHIQTGNELNGSLLEIFDANGRLIYKNVINRNYFDIEINPAPGVYSLRISNSNTTIVSRLTKL